MFLDLRIGRRWAMSVFLLLHTATNALGLVCYKCTISLPGRYSNETERLCSLFDITEPKYQVECPYSTFCMKKSIELSLPDGKVVRSAMRDCAPQKNNYHAYSPERGWEMTHTVEDSAYTEGCHSGPPQPNVLTPTDQYCYCKKNLCNTAKATHDTSMHHTDAMAVIFVFNAMKYIRSLR